jgi:hypothetical protein
MVSGEKVLQGPVVHLDLSPPARLNELVDAIEHTMYLRGRVLAAQQF